jgi:GlpG protein
MRYLAVIDDEAAARRFGDYLLSIGIPNSLESGMKGSAIWVERDDDVERARMELDSFQRDPADPRYARAARDAGAVRAQVQKRQRRLRRNYVDIRTSWAGLPRFGAPLTAFLIGVCLVVGLATRLGAKMDPVGDLLLIQDPTQLIERIDEAEQQIKQGEPAERVVTDLQTRLRSLSEIRSGQVWRLVTPIFIHYGVLHLVFNMWWLWDLGRIIEGRLGSLFLGAMVLATALLSNLAEFYWSGPSFGGMSGVVYALFGYLWIRGLLDSGWGLRLNSQIVLIMLAWLGLCMTGMLGSIANAAHVVGLLAGMGAAAAPVYVRRARRAMRRM